MKTIIKQENSNTVVYFEGWLDTSVAQQVQEDVDTLDYDSGKDIILDCSRLEYISSSGLRIFLCILKSAQPKGSHVYVRGLNDDLRQVFTMTGFINLFEYCK